MIFLWKHLVTGSISFKKKDVSDNPKRNYYSGLLWKHLVTGPISIFKKDASDNPQGIAKVIYL